MLTQETTKKFNDYKAKFVHIDRVSITKEYKKVFGKEPMPKQPIWDMREQLERHMKLELEKQTPVELEEMHNKFLDIQDQYNKMNQKYSDEHTKAGRLEGDNDKLRQRMDMLVDTLCGIMNMQVHSQGLRFR